MMATSSKILADCVRKMTSVLGISCDAAPQGGPGQHLRRDEAERSQRLRSELAVGQHKLCATFRNAPRCTLKAGELLGAANGWSDAIHHLRAGWACEFRKLGNGRRAIVYVYIPGDVIGLDTVLQTRPLEEVLTLTSVTVEAIPTKGALIELMGDRQTALYLAWLLGRRQRRADRLLAAISGLDARGRLAAMMLDFYTRLRRRKLITGSMYNLPLTQVQIGHYLGLTVVHINRVLRSLRDERIVDLEKHYLTILDLERLTGLTRNGGIVSSSSTIMDGRSVTEIALSARNAIL
jgi:CRP/FNR family transcriptional regulator, anaerobic regulatory protein